MEMFVVVAFCCRPQDDIFQQQRCVQIILLVTSYQGNVLHQFLSLCGSWSVGCRGFPSSSQYLTWWNIIKLHLMALWVVCT